MRVGKYRLSSLVRHDPLGVIRASVSIRSGHGSMTHDRVLRLARGFSCADDASRHALDEGLAWIRDTAAGCPPDGPATDQEPHPWPKKN